MVDVRVSTLPILSSTDDVHAIGYRVTGGFVRIAPSAFYPTLQQLGGITEGTVMTALALKQDSSARGIANGYAPLDGSGKVPAANLPAVSAGTGVTLSDAAPAALAVTAAPGVAVTASRSDHVHARPSAADVGAAPVVHTHIITAVTGLQAALIATEKQANKGIPDGYAPLDSTGKVPTANLPPQTAVDLSTKADTATVNAALALKANTTDVNTALGLKANNNDTRIVNAIQPSYLTPIDPVPSTPTIVQTDANRIKRHTGSADITITLPALSIGTSIRFITPGANKFVFAAGSSQTIESLGGYLITAGPGANVIATVVATNTWNISGGLA